MTCGEFYRFELQQDEIMANFTGARTYQEPTGCVTS